MGLSGKFKRYLVDGILLILPLVVVVFILNLLTKWASVVIDPLVKSTRLVQYTSNIEILAQAVAAISVILFLTFLGFLYTSPLGKGLKRRVGRFIDFIPLLGTIYLSIRQVASSIGDTGSRFKKLVVLEYPRDNIYSVGLVTGKAPNSLNIGQEAYTVFLPNSPNPTGGKTIVVPEEELNEVDMSVQRGLKLMVTTGIAFEEEELPDEFSEENLDE